MTFPFSSGPFTGGADDHLGDRVAALADGELDPATRDELLAHVAHCPGCRTSLAAERQAKAWLRQLPTPTPTTALLDRLGTLGGPLGPMAPAAHPLDGESPRYAAVAPPPRVRTRLLATSALLGTGVAASAALAFALGAPPPQQPVVTPPVDRYVVEHAATVVGVPMNDAAQLPVTSPSAFPGSPIGVLP